jgi:hypothetical protein
MVGRSFSWIEIVVLIGAIGAVTGSLLVTRSFEQQKPSIAREWPADAPVIELIVASLVLGTACAGPLVIAMQFLVRKRSSVLSMGEWLWTVPLALFAMAIISTNIAARTSDWAAMSLVCVYALLQWLASAASLLFLVSRAGNTWSDYVGSSACLMAGLYLAYNIYAHPISI